MSALVQHKQALLCASVNTNAFAVCTTIQLGASNCISCPLVLFIFVRYLFFYIVELTNSLLIVSLIFTFLLCIALREKCTYSELFWSAFSHIRTEYGEILRIFPYSAQVREDVDQNNPE